MVTQNVINGFVIPDDIAEIRDFPREFKISTVDFVYQRIAFLIECFPLRKEIIELAQSDNDSRRNQKLYPSDCRCSDKQHSEKRDCGSCASFKLLPPKHYRHTNHQHNSQNRRSTASYFRRSDACITVSRYVWRLIICRDWLSLFYRDA